MDNRRTSTNEKPQVPLIAVNILPPRQLPSCGLVILLNPAPTFDFYNLPISSRTAYVIVQNNAGKTLFFIDRILKTSRQVNADVNLINKLQTHFTKSLAAGLEKLKKISEEAKTQKSNVKSAIKAKVTLTSIVGLIDRLPSTGLATASKYVNDNLLAEGIRYLQTQIQQAKKLGFTQAWMNPIARIAEDSSCSRRDDDTGLMTTQYRSSYAYEDATAVIDLFESDEVKKMLADEKKNGFPILADFAWMYVADFGVFNASAESSQIKINKEIENAKKVIDFYLKTLHFSGLRIDGASHIASHPRIELLKYIRSNYPDAFILEEVLLDRTQELHVRHMADVAEQQGVFSDFVTSNIYYQKPDVFGALPLPKNMGDSTKLRLAKNNGIGFTGNHDHFSVGWCSLFVMAAERALHDSAFHTFIQKKFQASPRRDEGKEAGKIKETLMAVLKAIAEGTQLIEATTSEQAHFLKILLPFAIEIAREMMADDSNDDAVKKKQQKLLKTFKGILLRKIADRTLTSPSGYFMLGCELSSLLQTQRIFTNKYGDPLQMPLITAEDMLADKNHDLLKLIQSDMYADNKDYDNIVNFEKNLPLVVDGKPIKKKSASKTVAQPGTVNSDDKNRMRIWLPYLIEYFRNHPDKVALALPANTNLAAMEQRLYEKLGLHQFIKDINELYSKLNTPACIDYHTFVALDKYKIIVRCSEKNTDIIIVSVSPKLTDTYTIDAIDMQKIAIWLQSRLYPCSVAAGHLSVATPVQPFDKNNPVFPDSNAQNTSDAGWYSSYWKAQFGEAFDNAFMRVIGTLPGHKTTLYLGRGIKAADKEDLCYKNGEGVIEGQIHVVSVSKTPRELAQDAYYEMNVDLPLYSGESPAPSPQGSVADLGVFAHKVQNIPIDAPANNNANSKLNPQ